MPTSWWPWRRATLVSSSCASSGGRKLDQVVAEDVLLVEPEQRPHGGADVADRPVGGDREHHVADLRQRLVELDPRDQGADAAVGTGRSRDAAVNRPARGRGRDTVRRRSRTRRFRVIVRQTGSPGEVG